jgi:hypothetical protein
MIKLTFIRNGKKAGTSFAQRITQIIGPVVDEGRNAGVIGNGGLVLARMPVEMVEQRKQHYKGVTKNQMDAVDNDWMQENNPAMPKLAPQRKSSVSFGSGRKGG